VRLDLDLLEREVRRGLGVTMDDALDLIDMARRIEAVRAQHETVGRLCIECALESPCPTIRLLDGAG
jgi:hypothetical protein